MKKILLVLLAAAVKVKIDESEDVKENMPSMR